MAHKVSNIYLMCFFFSFFHWFQFILEQYWNHFMAWFQHYIKVTDGELLMRYVANWTSDPAANLCLLSLFYKLKSVQHLFFLFSNFLEVSTKTKYCLYKVSALTDSHVFFNILCLFSVEHFVALFNDLTNYQSHTWMDYERTELLLSKNHICGN